MAVGSPRAWLGMFHFHLAWDVSLARFTTFSSDGAGVISQAWLRDFSLYQIRVASSKFRSAMIPQFSIV